MSKTLTILFFPLEGHGNVNACHGLAEVLLQRGHRIIFAVNTAWNGLLTKYGFEEKVFNANINQNHNKLIWSEFINKNHSIMSLSSIGKIKEYYIPAFTLMLETHKSLENQYKNIIEEVKPNLIIIDHLICSPVLINSGIPWIWFSSTGPLCCISDDRTPPARSGNYTKI